MNNSQPQQRALISAYACEPLRGSEPGAGWHFTKAAAAIGDVVLLTREKYVESVNNECERLGLTSVEVVGVDLPKRARRWKKGNRGIHLYYLLWQCQVSAEAKRLHREKPFDLVHHVTLATDWMPAGAALPGVPFVWGPVGGSQHPPRSMLPWLGIRGLGKAMVRRCVVGVLGRLFGRHTSEKSSVLLAQNQEVLERYERFVENGMVFPNSRADQSTRIQRQSSTALFIGRLVEWKGVAIAIAAIALLGREGWQLRIGGSGPDRGRLERLALRLGANVVFLGQLSREDVKREMGSATVLLFPSLHDASGMTVAEARAAGLPVVCIKAGGPQHLLGEGSVAIEPSADCVTKLAEAVAQARPVDPSKDLSTEALASELSAIYELAMTGADNKY